MALQLRDTAPDFMADTTQGAIGFHEWARDSWVLLFSHSSDVVPGFVTELDHVASLKREFDKRRVKPIGLLVDDQRVRMRWSEGVRKTRGHWPDFPVIFDVSNAIAVRYGMLHPLHGVEDCVRTVLVIDARHKIRLVITYPQATAIDFDQILRVIDSLRITDAESVNAFCSEDDVDNVNIVSMTMASTSLPACTGFLV